MILCRAVVPNKWYHREHDGLTGENHPCPFKARKDGFCDRHHPFNLLPILKAKHARLTEQLKKVEADMKALPEVTEFEVHSPS